MSDIQVEYNEDKNIVDSIKKADKDKLAQQTADLWQQWTTKIKPLIDESDEHWALYFDNKPSLQWETKNPKQSKGRKGITLGQVPKNLESVLSVQHNNTFPGNDRYFGGVARNEFARQWLEPYSQWKMDQFNEYGLGQKMYEHRLNAALDGTSAAMVHFKTTKEKKVIYEEPPIVDLGIIQQLVSMLGGKLKRPKNKRKIVEKITHESTCFEPLSFNDWRVDPDMDCVDDAGFIRRYYCPTWEVKEDFGLKQVDSYHDYLDSNEQLKKDARGIVSIGTTESEGKEQALLMVRYDDFVIDGKVYKNHLAIVLNDSELIWFSPNPYDHGMRPYVITPYHKVPGSLYGKSAIRDAKAMANTADTAVTQLIDIMSWAAKPVFEKNLNNPAGKALGDIKIEPGMNIPAGAFAQFKIDTSGAQNLIPLVQQLGQYIEDCIGSNAAISGQDPSAGKGNITAFQVSTHVQGAMYRYLMPMKYFNQTVLLPFIKMSFENDKQFLEEDYLVPGFEEELTPEVIQLMDLDWTVTSEQASMQRQQQINILLEILSRYQELVTMGIVTPPTKQYEFEFGEVMKKLLNLSGFTDTDNTFKLVEAPDQITQAGVQDSLTMGGDNDGQAGLGVPSNGGVDPLAGVQNPAGISPTIPIAA